MWDKSRFQIAGAVGFLLVFTGLFAPVHEFGHWLLGEPGVKIILWNLTQHETLTVQAVIGGYLVEFYAAVAVSLLCRHWVRKRIWFNIMAGAWGYAIGVAMVAFFSEDFRILVTKWEIPFYIVAAGWLMLTVPVLTIVSLYYKNKLKNT